MTMAARSAEPRAMRSSTAMRWRIGNMASAAGRLKPETGRFSAAPGSCHRAISRQTMTASKPGGGWSGWRAEGVKCLMLAAGTDPTWRSGAPAAGWRPATDAGATALVKRYHFYDAEHRRYVPIERIRQWAANGAAFVVQDTATRTDVTRVLPARRRFTVTGNHTTVQQRIPVGWHRKSTRLSPPASPPPAASPRSA